MRRRVGAFSGIFYGSLCSARLLRVFCEYLGSCCVGGAALVRTAKVLRTRRFWFFYDGCARIQQSALRSVAPRLCAAAVGC